MQLTGRRMYKAIKEQIDLYGPINYHNAMASAHSIVAWLEERYQEKEEGEDGTKVGLDTSD